MPTSKKKPAVRKQATRKAPAAIDPAEKRLFKLCKGGDGPSRDELLGRYTGLAVTVARKYQAYFPGIDISELVAEGNRGLLEALERFDTRRGVRFSTYAWFWVVKNVQEYITSNVAVIGTPRKILSELKKVTSEMDKDAKRGRSRSLADIARALDMDEAMVRNMLMDRSSVGSVMSLDRALDDEDQAGSLGDILADRRETGLPVLMENADQRANLLLLLDRLDSREREVVSLRFGLKEEAMYSLKDVARRLKITPAKARDLEFMALMKLKRMLKADEA